MLTMTILVRRLLPAAAKGPQLLASMRHSLSGATARPPPCAAALPGAPSRPFSALRPPPRPRRTSLRPTSAVAAHLPFQRPPPPAPALCPTVAPFSTTTPRRLLDPRDPRVQDMMRRKSVPLFSSTQAKRIARAPSTHAVVVIAFAGAIAFYYSNLETVPVSGRQRFNCFSDEWVRRASEAESQQLLNEFKYHNIHMLPEWDWRVRAVRRVMARLIPVSGMDGAEWEMFVIDDPNTANAFVLPNGKVFVHSGLFKYARNDDALAVVMGHEIAHNLAGHVSEKMSNGIGTNLVYWSTILLAYATGAILIFEFFGGGRMLRGVLDNPMSRMQESEADHIGLIMMAEACYNPGEAINFWGRMQEQQVPEWLSTHPSRTFANGCLWRRTREWRATVTAHRASPICLSGHYREGR
ncbi:hypothetical protein RB599_005197 [Gaeumannomyces hyphopodioides]